MSEWETTAKRSVLQNQFKYIYHITDFDCHSKNHQAVYKWDEQEVCLERLRVFMAVTMKNTIFWNVTPCSSCKNRLFGGTHGLHHQGDENRQARNNVSSTSSVNWLLVTVNVVPSSPILVTLMMDELCSSETSVFTRAT
jgi:hypothetical protein